MGGSIPASPYPMIVIAVEEQSRNPSKVVVGAYQLTLYRFRAMFHLDLGCSGIVTPRPVQCVYTLVIVASYMPYCFELSSYSYVSNQTCTAIPIRQFGSLVT